MERQAQYINLDALRAAHRDLLEHRRQKGESSSFLNQVETFIQRGQATGSLLSADEERWEAQNLLDYWANELYHAHRDVADATLVDFSPENAPILPDISCPYIGLDTFGTDKQDYFFGRDNLIAAMVGKLQTTRGLMLIGPSGSGKSSAALAGLIPQIQGGALTPNGTTSSEHWHIYPPLLPGANPLANMVRLLFPEKAGHTQWIESEVKKLQQSNEYLAQQIHQTSIEPAVLLIDQFEEAFTLCYNDKARGAFVGNLLHLLQIPSPRHIIILTIRSDFESILVQIPDLHALFEQAQVRVTAMKASELREAIVKPAEKVGLVFEDGLVDKLVDEILGETAALPLLQFTLLKLWENRERNRVTWKAYHQLGGGRQALANSANAFFNNLPPDEQETAKQILLQIVQPGDGLTITRKRILRQELYRNDASKGQIDQLLDRLIEARLLRLTKDVTPDLGRVEIAHETLAYTWPRLIGWLEESRVAHRRRLRLATMAEEWQTRDHDPSTLLRGLLLEEAATYKDLSPVENAFVTASIEETHRERLAHEVDQKEKLVQTVRLYEEQVQRELESRRAAVRLRRLVIVLAAVFMIAVTAAISANINIQQVQESAVTAVTNEQIAEALRSNAEASEATAVASEATAIAARSTAEADANLRATAEAEANDQRSTAEQAATVADVARAEAEANAAAADALFRLATARELAASAIDQLNSDPQLSLLLALEAVNITYHTDQTAPTEAENALYRALKSSQLQFTLSGHTDWVQDVAYTHDGALIATAGLDTAVIVWNANTGQIVNTFTDFNRAVNSVAFNPADPHLAAAGSEGLVYIWNWESGRRIRILEGSGAIIRDIAYDSKGVLLAAAVEDVVRIWDASSGESLLRLTGHNQQVTAVTFTPDGSQLISADEGGQVIFWDLTTGTAVPKNNLPQVTENQEPVAINALALNPGGTQLAAALNNGAAIVWDLPSFTRIATLTGHASFVFSAAFSPDGNYLATASGDATIKVWDTESYRGAYTLSGHNSAVSAITFSPGGQHLASASQDGTAKVWNTQPVLDVSYLTGHLGPITSVDYSQDGRFIATGSDDKTVNLWDSDGNLVQTIPDPNNTVNDVVFSPDSVWVAAASDDQVAWVWDVATGQTVRIWQQHDTPLNVVRFAPDGSLLVVGGDNGNIWIWSMDDGQLYGRFNHGSIVHSLAFHPNGTTLATAGEDGRVQLWDIPPGDPIQTLSGHEGPINSIAFNADGTRLATASGDGTSKLWDVARGQPIFTFSGHTGAVTSVAFSPDGSRLATTSVDKTAKLWDTATGQVLRTLDGHTATVHSVAFNADGSRLATASSDRTAQINELTSLDELFNRGQAQVIRKFSPEECAQYLRGLPCLMQE